MKRPSSARFLAHLLAFLAPFYRGVRSHRLLRCALVASGHPHGPSSALPGPAPQPPVPPLRPSLATPITLRETSPSTLLPPPVSVLPPPSSLLALSCSSLLPPRSSLLPPHSLLAPRSSLLTPRSSLLTPRSSLLTPRSSLLTPRSSLLAPRSSLLAPRSSLLAPHFSLLATLFLLFLLPTSASAKKLQIGVTLHPYYSWVANIVGDQAEVVPVLPGDSNVHTYQPRPDELVALAQLDAIVVNGIGHDDFIEPMLEAASRREIPRIRPNDGLPLIENNSHSFLAILGSIQQIHSIARELGKLDSPNADLYAKNATAYARRLRGMLAAALQKLAEVDTTAVRIATVHEGYTYLFQELGLPLAAVVQPRHGIEPSAKQLADTVSKIREARINLLFTEMDLDAKYVDTIFEETQCRVLKLSHMSSGPYTAGRFEQDMQTNLDTIVQALTAPR